MRIGLVTTSVVALAAFVGLAGASARAQDDGGDPMMHRHMMHRMMRHEMHHDMMRHEMHREMRHRRMHRMMREEMHND